MKHLLQILLLPLLLLTTCHHNPAPIQNNNGNKIQVLGHGGLGINHLSPMNSWASIQEAMKEGAQGIEVDVQMTEDGVLVAYHDRYLEEATNGEGRMIARPWSEVKKLHYSIIPFYDEPLASLEEIMENLVLAKGQVLLLDIKNFYGEKGDREKYDELLLKNLQALMRKKGRGEEVILELTAKKQMAIMKKLGMEQRVFMKRDLETLVEWRKEFPFLTGAIWEVNKISAKEVKALHQKGFQVAVYNVHSRSRNIDAIDKNVDFILSDKVAQSLRLLGDFATRH